MLIISAIIVGTILIYFWVKIINAIFNPIIRKSESKEIVVNNPYIEDHLTRQANDKNYEDYLKWLDETGGDLPIKKVLTREEWEFKKQLNL